MPARSRPSGTGRYPPQPRFQPFSFYSCVRLGDPEQLKLVRVRARRTGRESRASHGPSRPDAAQIMETDPYFWSQNNGAGAPIHFATTYKRLDMVRSDLRLEATATRSLPARRPATRSAGFFA